MKKTLSVLAVLGIIGIGMQSAEAFSWSYLNPANWGHCPRCQKVKTNCGCPNNNYKDAYTTGGAANCDPCAQKKVKKNPCHKMKKCDPCKTQQTVQPCDPCNKEQQPCDPCNKLQEMNK